VHKTTVKRISIFVRAKVNGWINSSIIWFVVQKTFVKMKIVIFHIPGAMGYFLPRLFGQLGFRRMIESPLLVF